MVISKTCTMVGCMGVCYVLHVHAYQSICKPLHARANCLVPLRQGLSSSMRFPILPLGLYSCIPLTLGLEMLAAMPGFHMGAEDPNSGQACTVRALTHGATFPAPLVRFFDHK